MTRSEEQLRNLLAEEAANALKACLDQAHDVVPDAPTNVALALRIHDVLGAIIRIRVRLLAEPHSVTRYLDIDSSDDRVGHVGSLWTLIADMVVDLIKLHKR